MKIQILKDENFSSDTYIIRFNRGHQWSFWHTIRETDLLWSKKFSSIKDAEEFLKTWDGCGLVGAKVVKEINKD